jgi:hypothetical protein
MLSRLFRSIRSGRAHAPAAAMRGAVMRRRLALGLILVLPLAACGRRGPPVPPPDVDPKAPRNYPVQ